MKLNVNLGPTVRSLGPIPLKKAPNPSLRIILKTIFLPLIFVEKSLFCIRVFITSMGDETVIQALDAPLEQIKCCHNVALSLISKLKSFDFNNVDAPKRVNDPTAFLLAVHKEPE